MINNLKLWLNSTFVKLFGKPILLSRIMVILLVIIVAVAIRLFIVLHEAKLIGGDDAGRHDVLARNLVEGNGFSKAFSPPYYPDDFDQPGYPFFVATIYRFTSGSLKAVIVVQLLLELTTLLLVLRISERLELFFSHKMFALAIGLVCPLLPIFSARIINEVLATFILTLNCYLLIKASRRENLAGWVYAGLACGFSLLVRPDLVIAVILMIMVASIVCWRYHRMRGSYLLICTLVCFIVITPWAIRNYLCFSKILFLGRSSEQTYSGYARWLNTWLVDYNGMKKYWWLNLSDPSFQCEFPSNIFQDNEKERAEQALRLARDQGTFDGQPSKEFIALACEARQIRPLNTCFFVPVQRVFYTWGMMPEYIDSGLRRFSALHHLTRLSYLFYLCWIIFTMFVLIGIVT